MKLEVKIPSVGESITSGYLSEWKVESGASVQSGDILFLLETDKISTEVNAEQAGVIEIQVPGGEDVAVGQVVGIIDTEAAARNESNAAPKKVEDTQPAPAAKAEVSAEKPNEAPKAAAPPAQPAKSQSTALATSETRPQRTDRETRSNLSPLRRRVADTLVKAQHTSASLTTFNECDMSAVMGLRKTLQDDFTDTYGIKLGLMSFFVKAVVEALRTVPKLNARIEENTFIQNHYFDVGVAVSTEKGLMVPVLRDVDTKSFADIEKALADYAQKAREGKITIEDLQGGVFTLSNGGIFGSLLSTPILNYPQAGILGMHTIQQRPIAQDGQVVIRPMMYLALTYDHRVVDGREAVTFLVRIKECIEEPARLLVQA
ncbi:MAG: dihydrolipoyllysine-residue succinyltransferase [Verrucomicrobiales bacterium]